MSILAGSGDKANTTLGIFQILQGSGWTSAVMMFEKDRVEFGLLDWESRRGIFQSSGRTSSLVAAGVVGIVGDTLWRDSGEFLQQHSCITGGNRGTIGEMKTAVVQTGKN